MAHGRAGALLVVVPPTQLACIVFGSLARAQEALAAADDLDPVDAVIVMREPDGRLGLRQTRQRSFGESAVAGGTVGLLTGLFLGAPVGVAVAGLAAGAGFGARDTGIADDRLRAVGRRELDSDEALLCVLVDDSDAAALAACLEPYGGETVSA
jgi:uncharacterized membrane protein